ncbi:MAG TPA: CoA-transferase [Myxococcota bacterium]|nr:CoA-transferase [Myxococcota bacterium]HRY93903.1 CoA-transferase [Myxococcota bacterium]
MGSTSQDPRYTPTELLACVASGFLEDGCSVFVGTGLPLIATMLAQRTHAPGLLIFFEAGSFGPQLKALPISVGDSRTLHRAISASSMHDLMSISQAGFVDYGFLGGAQMDSRGNINTTVIGDHALPKARLPGSGGANDVASFAHRTLIIMRQSERSFVGKLDFLTTPGHLDGPGGRQRAGLPVGDGPYRVVTQLAVYDFDEGTKRLRLHSLHPGVDVAAVQKNSGFSILVPERVAVSPAPTAEQLRLLREVIDPAGIVIGK